MAEGVGFEPTEPLRALLFSRQVHSAAMRPLRDPVILQCLRSQVKLRRNMYFQSDLSHNVK